MNAQEEILRVRQQVDRYIGSKVLIKTNKGRKRVLINEGVLQSTYPSIFVVNVHNESLDTYRMVSYMYSDLITNEIEMTVSNDEESE